jgi:hypothetical protein
MAFVTIGVHFGQEREPTAICVAEIEERNVAGWYEDHFLIRHLERLPVGAPYPAITERVTALIQRLRTQHRATTLLNLNATGIGTPLVDLIRRQPISVRVWDVYFNHGDRRIVVDHREIGLGKAFVVTRLQTLLQAHRIHLPESEEVRILAEELLGVRGEGCRGCQRQVWGVQGGDPGRSRDGAGVGAPGRWASAGDHPRGVGWTEFAPAPTRRPPASALDDRHTGRRGETFRAGRPPLGVLSLVQACVIVMGSAGELKNDMWSKDEEMKSDKERTGLGGGDRHGHKLDIALAGRLDELVARGHKIWNPPPPGFRHRRRQAGGRPGGFILDPITRFYRTQDTPRRPQSQKGDTANGRTR